MNEKKLLLLSGVLAGGYLIYKKLNSNLGGEYKDTSTKIYYDNSNDILFVAKSDDLFEAIDKMNNTLADKGEVSFGDFYKNLNKSYPKHLDSIVWTKDVDDINDTTSVGFKLYLNKYFDGYVYYIRPTQKPQIKQGVCDNEY